MRARQRARAHPAHTCMQIESIRRRDNLHLFFLLHVALAARNYLVLDDAFFLFLGQKKKKSNEKAIENQREIFFTLNSSNQDFFGCRFASSRGEKMCNELIGELYWIV